MGDDQHEELDRLILMAVAERKNPIYNNKVCMEAERLSLLSKKAAFYITQRRLQVLRKKGVIAYEPKGRIRGDGGWRAVEDEA